MLMLEGLYWPNDVGEKYQHALMHVQSLEWAIAHVSHRRTAVQAGGNVGLWPRRLAASFQRVITFEPDAISRECLIKNVPSNVEVIDRALGAAAGQCGLRHKSLGSHHVLTGDAVPVQTIDALGLTDLDLLQLDVEGYEWHVLQGAAETIDRCRPMIQLELRPPQLARYYRSSVDVREWLAERGYRQVSAQQGSDYVFAQVAA